jgi:Tfp pilus assembly protein PilV
MNKLFGLILIGVAFFIAYSLLQQEKPTKQQQAQTQQEQLDAQHQREQKQLEAQQRREQEEEERKAKAEAEERANNQAAATAMGVSLETYLWAKPAANAFYMWCQERVASNTTYRSRKDWTPNFTWSVNKSRSEILISGQDLQIKNAFGTLYYVLYVCVAKPDHPGQSTKSLDGWQGRVVSVQPLHGAGLIE